jgi:hypothetical protein
MHHDPADVLEISMAAASPTGILDERDPFGAKYIGEPDRVAASGICTAPHAGKTPGRTAFPRPPVTLKQLSTSANPVPPLGLEPRLCGF